MGSECVVRACITWGTSGFERVQKLSQQGGFRAFCFCGERAFLREQRTFVKCGCSFSVILKMNFLVVKRTRRSEGRRASVFSSCNR